MNGKLITLTEIKLCIEITFDTNNYKSINGNSMKRMITYCLKWMIGKLNLNLSKVLNWNVTNVEFGEYP